MVPESEEVNYNLEKLLPICSPSLLIMELTNNNANVQQCICVYTLFFYKKVVYKKVLIFLSKFKKVYINRTNYFKKVFKKGSKKQDIPIDQNTIEKLNKKTMVIGIIIQPLRIYYTYACFSTSVEFQV